MLKIDSDSKIAALMESIAGSISSEATRPQRVDRNNEAGAPFGWIIWAGSAYPEGLRCERAAMGAFA